MRVTRRGFLGGSLAALAVPGLAPAAPSPRLRRAMVRVGRRYLADHPHEASPVLLRRRLGLGPTAGLADALAAATRRRADEFSRKETVLVGGWLLARAEARACALAAVVGGSLHVA